MTDETEKLRARVAQFEEVLSILVAENTANDLGELDSPAPMEPRR